MTSVFGNVFRMSNGDSVWAQVFVLAESTVPSEAGWTTRPAMRVSVPAMASRLSITSPQERLWIARIDNG